MDKGQLEVKKNNWLTNFLFSYTRKTIPDGRPLYAYKCDDKKYIELKEQLIQQQKYLDYNRASASQFPYYFCLYAAETFCREHDGGVWTWDTVFKPLGKACPSQPIIAEWVEVGLKWWNRKLIFGQHGDRRLLTTIACEGGLPLRLLHNDNANIYKFFRTILENYHAQGCGGIEIAETIARNHSYRLPKSLRQDVVFRLGAELITVVVELQGEIGTVPNPIIALDEKIPNWRLRLPLRLEEQVALTLFKGLVIDIGHLVQAANARFRWQGILVQTPTGWQVKKCLEMPDTFSCEQVQQWLGPNISLPARLRLLLHTTLGTQNIAWLTLSRKTDEEKSFYRREWLNRGGFTLIDKSVMEPHQLSLHDGQNEYFLTVENGEPWGEIIPWLFVEKNSTSILEFLGEGSVQTRAEKAWVLAGDSLSLQTNGTSSWENLGTISTILRTVYSIDSTVDVLNTENDRYRMVCKATNDSSETYKVVGETYNNFLNRFPIYCGLPRISNSLKNDRTNYRTQWRPVNYDGNWQQSEINCVGRIWLRLFDASESVEIFRRQVSVLPKSFRIESVIGEAATPGVYHLFGLLGASVSISAGQHSCKCTVIADGVDIICPRLQTTSLPELEINLNWLSGALTLHLPYPQRGAVFQMAGKMLQRDDFIPLDRFGGLRLLVLDQIGGKRYWLNAELIAKDAIDAGLPRLQFRDHLPTIASGRCETTLLVWHERIASLLNSSRSIDAYVRLDITSTAGESLTRLQVARFDCTIEPQRLLNQIRFSNDTLERLGTEWQQRVSLKMIPLWSPKSCSKTLDPNPEHIACWNVPYELAPGPWWIIARDGNWARFRPLLWSVKNHQEAVNSEEMDSALRAAIREPKAYQRELMLNELLLELGKNPEHPDWLILFELIKLSREFSTSSLDVLTQLISFPQTLAMALLKADDDELFNCVWALAEQMPFSWSLLSVNCWLEAAALQYSFLRAALGEIDSNGEIVFGIFQKFRDHTCSKREFWASLCDWLQEHLFKNSPLQQSPLQIARIMPGFFDGQIQDAEQELQNRHDADEQWPQSDEVMQRVKEIIAERHQYQRLSPPYRAVRCAPFVLACLSIKGMTSSKELMSELEDSEWVDLRQLYPYVITDSLIYELRLLRAFDSDWFDAVYAIALTLELSRLPMEATK